MRVPAVVGLILALVLLAGCSRLGLVPKSLSLETVYPSPNQSDVTVRYSLPRPPKGKVYVLWIVNPVQGKSANVGTLAAGRDHTARARVDFEAVGAVVSIENNPSARTMSADWAIKAGQVTPVTPTPSIIDLTPTVTPNASVTPTAG